MSQARRVFHEEIESESVVLSPEESHHALKALRLKTGDALEVFDGKGGSRPARLGEIRKHEAEVVFTEPKVSRERQTPWITLAVAPPKGQRMDTLVQMAQEIGLDELIPIITENAVRQEFSGNRYERWRRVSIAAAKQSGAGFLVEMKPAVDIMELLKDLRRWDMRVLCHTAAQTPSLRELMARRPKPKRVLVAVGPEGGFSEQEISAAGAVGCAAVRLPALTLRVETAAVFALSALCHEFDRTF